MNALQDELTVKRMELASKIVDALIDTLMAVNHPLIVVNGDDIHLAAPGEIVRTDHA